jgi:hypothetical protein
MKPRRIGCAGYLPPMRLIRNAHKISVPKTERKREIRKHRRRWEDNVIMDLRGTEEPG